MISAKLMIVMSLAAAGQPEWKGVADALEAKHAGEAAVVRVTAEPSVTNALSQLKAEQPTHVAFVMRPDEAVFPTVLALKRMMRDLDDDPYDDAKWGIVTGPTAADAKRIASSREPREIRTALTTTGISDDTVSGPFACFSDAYPAGEWRIRSADGTIEKHATSNDLSSAFCRAWNTIDPDLVITSGHASQRNVEMPFSRGNVIPRNGAFRTLPNATLIDYSTGQAKKGEKRGGEDAGEPLAAPRREKVWIAAGNCLIADNLRPGDNMVMTALGFGKVNQFVGYTATTWFGEIGWGTLGNFRNGMSLVDAYYAANEQLIRELEETVTNANGFRPVFTSARDYERLFGEVRRYTFVAKGPVADRQKFVGRLWDRDATVFYGDPLQQVYLKR